MTHKLDDLPKHIINNTQIILKDGKPRRANEIAQILRDRFGIVVHKSFVNKVLYNQGAPKIIYDEKVGYRLDSLYVEQKELHTFSRMPKTDRSLATDFTYDPGVETTALQKNDISNTTPLFQENMKVRLKTDQTRIGVINKPPKLRESGWDYSVFIDGKEKWFAERSLESLPTNRLRWRKRDEFLRDLLISKSSSSLTDSLYAYRASKTVFEPYQFRPALKFLSNPDQRILIADEVGLGKTIEAAIIYLELKSRLNIARVLVMCPSRLRQKWHDELRNRFDEDFHICDTQSIRHLLRDYEKYGNSMSFKAIVSYESMRSSEFIEIVAKRNLHLDLLIVDEAHYMRNRGTKTHEMGQSLSYNSDAIIFLTATPLQLGQRDFFNLLNLLSPGDFKDEYIFDQIIEPNAYINHAARLVALDCYPDAKIELSKVEQTAMAKSFQVNPFYGEILDTLDETYSPNLETRLDIRRKILGLSTISNIFTRTRKREIATKAAKRVPHTVKVDLTDAEYNFYQGVIEFEIERYTDKGIPLGFVLATKERKAASCLPAMLAEYEDAQRKTVRLEYDLADVYADEVDHDELEIALSAPRAELLMLGREMKQVDSKFEKFIEALMKALEENPVSKALVFSTYKATLRYLQKRLRDYGIQANVIHGDVEIADRYRYIEDFRKDPDQRVFLSSEVGAEGLDFQFCDILVNYDLPWNPMQVEQRIGRLDRFGQLHNRIRIFNMVIENTIETRIFERLYARINIFQEAVGDLEAILGEEIKQITTKVYQYNLTPDEQVQLAEEAAERIVHRMHAAEEFEQRRSELMAEDVLFLEEEVRRTVDAGRVIYPEEVFALIKTYLSTAFPDSYLEQVGEEPVFVLSMDSRLTAHLRELVNKQRKTLSDGFRQSLSQGSLLRITFDSEFALERPSLEFVTIHHPISIAAREYWDGELTKASILPSTLLTINGENNETGTGFFYIYLLEQKSLTPRRSLQTVIVLDDGRLATQTAKYFFRALHETTQKSTELEKLEDIFINNEEVASDYIAQLRDQEYAQSEARNEALIAQRAATLRASYNAKISQTEERLRKVTEERIQRMYSTMIKNHNSDLQFKLYQLEETRQVSVSYSWIAGGRIQILPSIKT